MRSFTPTLLSYDVIRVGASFSVKKYRSNERHTSKIQHFIIKHQTNQQVAGCPLVVGDKAPLFFHKFYCHFRESVDHVQQAENYAGSAKDSQQGTLRKIV